jgi:GT2 family glycosyltransferase
MIPVLICPVLSRFDLLERMIASIDHPVGRLVIVDNSLTGYSNPEAAVIRPITGLGYPGGINAGILQTPDAPWWAWVNNDIEFGPGDLAHIAEVMDAAQGPTHLTGSDRRLRNAYGAMNAACIDTVGLFDDWAFYPIYFDDDDYEYRCRLGGVEWLTYDGTINHAGSMTINSDEHLRAENSRSFMQNRARYIAKWGGVPGHECFSRPYDLPVPLSYSAPDIAGRAMRLWK